MIKKMIVGAVVVVTFTVCIPRCMAQKRPSDILKEGILGAGAGAVGGAVSGARGGDIWKGALAGAGVSIVGGALLDSISGEPLRAETQVQKMDSRDAYTAGYQDGYTNAYKAGYAEGFKEGLKEGARSQ